MSAASKGESDWLTVAELAQRWRVSTDTIRHACHVRTTPDEAVPAGKIPAMRVTRQLRIRRDVVERAEALALPGDLRGDEAVTQADLGKARRVAAKARQLVNVPDEIGD